MAKSVFIHRADSIYDDLPAERYQFPRQYLQQVQRSVGDWILYYEPVKVAASKGYFAVARVLQVIPDPSATGLFLAIIEPGSYIEFEAPVAFKGPEGYRELGVLNDAGRLSGRAQAAVRNITDQDFARIVGLGLPDEADVLPRSDDVVAASRVTDEPPAWDPAPRSRVAMLGTRLYRDQVFRRIVLRAYDERCAITGLKFINGGGRAEAEAAHIVPVEKHGPDEVKNGLALSGTVHWMFDRGLISLADDMSILISRQVNDRDSIEAIINKDGRARPPLAPSDRPHPRYLAWHRENRFKA